MVACGGGLETYCVGDGDKCRYVGVDVNLGRVMVEQRSLRRIFTLILVDLVLIIFYISCVLSFDS